MGLPASSAIPSMHYRDTVRQRQNAPSPRLRIDCSEWSLLSTAISDKPAHQDLG